MLYGSSFIVRYQESRNLLGKVGLGGHAHEVKHRDLSGGQKARVVFAYLMCQTPHILFLDEPTNNLVEILINPSRLPPTQLSSFTILFFWLFNSS